MQPITHAIDPPSRLTHSTSSSATWFEQAAAAPQHSTCPSFTTTTLPSPTSATLTIPPTPSATNTLLMLANATKSFAFFGVRGGRPSYLIAAAASRSKFGVRGTRWKDSGLVETAGSVSWGIPSIQTCCGVAPSARGWLSQRTRST
jgi:hypothetical protein